MLSVEISYNKKKSHRILFTSNKKESFFLAFFGDCSPKKKQFSAKTLKPFFAEYLSEIRFNLIPPLKAKCTFMPANSLRKVCSRLRRILKSLSAAYVPYKRRRKGISRTYCVNYFYGMPLPPYKSP